MPTKKLLLFICLLIRSLVALKDNEPWAQLRNLVTRVGETTTTRLYHLGQAFSEVFDVLLANSEGADSFQRRYYHYARDAGGYFKEPDAVSCYGRDAGGYCYGREPDGRGYCCGRDGVASDSLQRRYHENEPDGVCWNGEAFHQSNRGFVDKATDALRHLANTVKKLVNTTDIEDAAQETAQDAKLQALCAAKDTKLQASHAAHCATLEASRAAHDANLQASRAARDAKLQASRTAAQDAKLHASCAAKDVQVHASHAAASIKQAITSAAQAAKLAASHTSQTVVQRTEEAARSLKYAAAEKTADSLLHAKENAQELAHAAKENAQELAHAAKKNAQELAHAAKDNAQELARSAKDNVQELAHAAKHAAAKKLAQGSKNAKDMASHMVHETKDMASHVVHETKDMASHMVHETKDMMHDSQDVASHVLHNAESTTQNVLNQAKERIQETQRATNRAAQSAKSSASNTAQNLWDHFTQTSPHHPPATFLSPPVCGPYLPYGYPSPYGVGSDVQYHVPHHVSRDDMVQKHPKPNYDSWQHPCDHRRCYSMGGELPEGLEEVELSVHKQALQLKAGAAGMAAQVVGHVAEFLELLSHQAVGWKVAASLNARNMKDNTLNYLQGKLEQSKG